MHNPLIVVVIEDIQFKNVKMDSFSEDIDIKHEPLDTDMECYVSTCNLLSNTF